MRAGRRRSARVSAHQTSATGAEQCGSVHIDRREEARISVCRPQINGQSAECGSMRLGAAWRGSMRLGVAENASRRIRADVFKPLNADKCGLD